MLPAQQALPIWLLAIGASALFLDSDVAYAELSEESCEAGSGLIAEREFAVARPGQTGSLTVINSANKYDKKAVDKVIYVHSRDDQSGAKTVMGVKITFSTQGNYTDQNWIRAQNNFKRGSVKATFQEYQDYHSGSIDLYELKTNFHLPKGAFNTQIPFTTFEPPDRRRQLMLAPNGSNEERTYRAYLITLKGVRPQGSCVDFSPYSPSDAKQIKVEIVDLLPASDSDMYYHYSLDFGFTE